MESLLLVENTDAKLSKLLAKMGYKLVEGNAKTQFAEVASREFVNLIVIDGRASFDAMGLCHMLREDEHTKRIPIVILAKDDGAATVLDRQRYYRVEAVKPPYRFGDIVGKISTQLRVSKLRGANPDAGASLIEVNAALRDLNRKFKKELENARSIQQSLLPKSLPVSEKFEVATTYLPLDQVGGDWLDVRVLPSGKVILLVADVTGHGIAAALISSMTKLAVSAAEREKPDELLIRVNSLMCPQLPPDTFVTVSCLLYDPDSGALSVGCGGHPPSLLLHRKEGLVQALKAPGMAVGMLEEGLYEGMEAQLEVGDVVVSYSDGIIEAQNRSRKFYGQERLAEVIKQTSAEQTAQDILNAIKSDFDKFIDGKRLKDDVTIAVLRRNA